MPGADGAQQKQPVPQLPETSTHAPIVQTKMHELGHGVVVVVVVELEELVVVPSGQSTKASSSIYVPGSDGAGPHVHPTPSHESM
jgi:hypothetical protein